MDQELDHVLPTAPPGATDGSTIVLAGTSGLRDTVMAILREALAGPQATLIEGGIEGLIEFASCQTPDGVARGANDRLPSRWPDKLANAPGCELRGSKPPDKHLQCSAGMRRSAQCQPLLPQLPQKQWRDAACLRHATANRTGQIDDAQYVRPVEPDSHRFWFLGSSASFAPLQALRGAIAAGLAPSALRPGRDRPIELAEGKLARILTMWTCPRRADRFPAREDRSAPDQ